MNVTMVKKRDGRSVKFDKEKIRDAVIAAFNDVDKEITSEAKRTATRIANYIESLDINTRTLDVEEIQDIVRDKLMGSERKDVAERFVVYRNDRTRERDRRSIFFKTVKKKAQASDVQNQNANVDEYSFGGRMGEANSELMRKLASDEFVSPMARKNHEENMIYIHDFDHYPIGDHNCTSIPFDDLLANGFNTRQTDVRPANSINTAFQLLAVIFQLQSLQQFGGVSSTHLDWTMVPYVRKSFLKHYIVSWLKDTEEFIGLDLMGMLFDNYEEKIQDNLKITRNRFDDWVDIHKDDFFRKSGLNKEDFFIGNDKLDKKHYQSALFDTIIETQQAVEGMYHNLNTLQSRSGNQLPFTSINYGTCTKEEGRIITKAVLDGSLKGVGALRKTSIFPCGIFQCMRGVNRKKGEPNYDLFRLALRSTAQRLYPNYANVDWSVNAGFDINDPKTYVSTMGWRKPIAHLKPFEPLLAGVA